MEDAPELASEGAPAMRANVDALGGEVVFRSPVSDQHRAFRQKLAESMAWDDWQRPTHDGAPPPLDRETGIPAFVEGGALWIYEYDRDFVFWHSPQVLQALVLDVVMTGDEERAKELSADLLKDRDQGPMSGLDYSVAETTAKTAWGG